MKTHLNITRNVESIGIKTGIYLSSEIPKARAMWLVSRGFAYWCDNPESGTKKETAQK